MWLSKFMFCSLWLSIFCLLHTLSAPPIPVGQFIAPIIHLLHKTFLEWLCSNLTLVIGLVAIMELGDDCGGVGSFHTGQSPVQHIKEKKINFLAAKSGDWSTASKNLMVFRESESFMYQPRCFLLEISVSFLHSQSPDLNIADLPSWKCNILWSSIAQNLILDQISSFLCPLAAGNQNIFTCCQGSFLAFTYSL